MSWKLPCRPKGPNLPRLRTQRIWLIRRFADWKVWGAAPRPGREKFSLHPRHVRWTCQLNDAVESSGYALTYSGLALRACTLRSPGRKAPLSCTPGTSATCQLACPTGDSGDAGNAGAPFRAMGGELGKLIKRETEGGGRGQRRSRRATDGARSGSRPPLRLCGSKAYRRTFLLPYYIVPSGGPKRVFGETFKGAF